MNPMKTSILEPLRYSKSCAKKKVERYECLHLKSNMREVIARHRVIPATKMAVWRIMVQCQPGRKVSETPSKLISQAW
jgi:hypothetical protein